MNLGRPVVGSISSRSVRAMFSCGDPPPIGVTRTRYGGGAAAASASRPSHLAASAAVSAAVCMARSSSSHKNSASSHHPVSLSVRAVPSDARSTLRGARHRGDGAFLSDAVGPDEEERSRFAFEFGANHLRHARAHFGAVRECPSRVAVRCVEEEFADRAVAGDEVVERGVLSDASRGSKVAGVQHGAAGDAVSEVQEDRTGAVVGVEEGDGGGGAVRGGNLRAASTSTARTSSDLTPMTFVRSAAVIGEQYIGAGPLNPACSPHV